jgi:hypothetical protein
MSDLSLAFVFTSQGAQWIGMGKELFYYEVFRKSILDAVMYLVSLGCYWHFVGACIDMGRAWSDFGILHSRKRFSVSSKNLFLLFQAV